MNLGGASRRQRHAQRGAMRLIPKTAKTQDLHISLEAGSPAPRNFPPLPNIEIGEPWKIPTTRENSDDYLQTNLAPQDFGLTPAVHDR